MLMYNIGYGAVGRFLYVMYTFFPGNLFSICFRPNVREYLSHPVVKTDYDNDGAGWLRQSARCNHLVFVFGLEIP